MRTVLIVDDEATIRLGLGTFINQLKGFVVAGECRNGFEAMEKISGLKPDIVVTDIKMPRMDGITLMKEALKLDCPPKFIILSGYNEFEYAREAVKSGAFDYILKPVDHENLEKVMYSLDELIKEELKKKIIIRQQKGLELITGNCEFIDVLPPAMQYTAVVFDFDTFTKDTQTASPGLHGSMFRVFYDKLRDTFETLQLQDSIIFSYNEKVAAILAAKPKTISESNHKNGALDTLIKKILQLISNDLNVRCYAGVGRTSCNHNDLQASYQEAVSACNTYLCYNEDTSVFWFCEASKIYINDAAQFLVDFKKIADLFHTVAEEQLELHLDSVFKDIKKARCHPGSIMSVCMQFILFMSDSFSCPVTQPWDILTGVKGIDEIKSRLKAFLLDCRRYEREQGEKQYGFLINEAVKYLNQHYSDSKLSLKGVCQTFHMDTSYFCRLFKAKTGKNFNEYLTGIRMEKAKKLMASADRKIYEISGMVGFPDVKYFCRLFKKITGCTPQEYRDKLIYIS